MGYTYDRDQKIIRDYEERVEDLESERDQYKAALIEAREASQEVVNRWHTPNWKDVEHTGQYIQRLEHQITKINQLLGETNEA